MSLPPYDSTRFPEAPFSDGLFGYGQVVSQAELLQEFLLLRHVLRSSLWLHDAAIRVRPTTRFSGGPRSGPSAATGC